MTTALSIPLGRIVATAGVAEWFSKSIARHAAVHRCIVRHQLGDWGDVCDEDRATNDAAARSGERLLSEYTVDDRRLWVITEWDRSVTTVLFPEEY